MAKAKKLPSGHWRVIATKTINGKKIRKSFTDTTANAAQLAAAEWLVLSKEKSETKILTLRAAYESYIKSKENILSPSTIRGYNTLLNCSLCDIMDFNIYDLTLPILQNSINIYAANHSPKGVRNCAGLLSAVLGMFRPDFNVKLTLPQKAKTEMHIPDDAEIQQLFKIVENTKMEIPILLAAIGPMRRGEICALTSDDIHGNIITVNKSMVKTPDNQWIIKKPKTYSSYRQIEYPDFVIQKLKGIKGKITDLSPNYITEEFLKILRKNNIPEFRFHDLRHYAVSSLHAINIPDKYIMQRGGWSTNYTMNNVYNHALKSKTDLMEEKIKKHFSDVYCN